MLRKEKSHKEHQISRSGQLLKKSQPEEFDLVILGGGTGSTVAAWTFAGEGKRVAAVDRKYIRGSCPNIACLLSKNIIHGAKVVDYVRRSKKFGIAHEGFTVGRGQDFDRSVSVGKPAQGQRIERLPYGQELDTAR